MPVLADHHLRFCLYILQACMNDLELLTQDYFVILLICHISNITLNVDLLSFVNNATKSCNKKVKFLAKMFISNTLSVTDCNISNMLCEYKKVFLI